MSVEQARQVIAEQEEREVALLQDMKMRALVGMILQKALSCAMWQQAERLQAFRAGENLKADLAWSLAGRRVFDNFNMPDEHNYEAGDWPDIPSNIYQKAEALDTRYREILQQAVSLANQSSAFANLPLLSLSFEGNGKDFKFCVSFQ